MNDISILPLRDVPERLDEAAGWFHDKWKIPLNAYLDSMRDCLSDPSRIPQWYLALSPGGVILGGAGVILGLRNQPIFGLDAQNFPGCIH